MKINLCDPCHIKLIDLKIVLPSTGRSGEDFKGNCEGCKRDTVTVHPLPVPDDFDRNILLDLNYLKELTPDEKQKSLIDQVVDAKTKANGVFVQLFHGRKDPTEDLDDWGEQGPVFFVDWFHVTYGTHVRMGNKENDDMELRFVKDLIYYDGMYYGDMSVFGHHVPLEEIQSRLTTYEEEKAKPQDVEK